MIGALSSSVTAEERFSAASSITAFPGLPIGLAEGLPIGLSTAGLAAGLSTAGLAAGLSTEGLAAGLSTAGLAAGLADGIAAPLGGAGRST